MDSLSLVTDKDTEIKKGLVARLRSHGDTATRIMTSGEGVWRGAAGRLNLHFRQQDPASREEPLSRGVDISKAAAKGQVRERGVHATPTLITPKS